MKAENVPAILAIMVVGTFLVTTTMIAVIPLLTVGSAEAYGQHLKDYWSLYSGIMGLIIGFYFGRQKERGGESQDGRQQV